MNYGVKQFTGTLLCYSEQQSNAMLSWMTVQCSFILGDSPVQCYPGWQSRAVLSWLTVQLSVILADSPVECYPGWQSSAVLSLAQYFCTPCCGTLALHFFSMPEWIWCVQMLHVHQTIVFSCLALSKMTCCSPTGRWDQIKNFQSRVFVFKCLLDFIFNLQLSWISDS